MLIKRRQRTNEDIVFDILFNVLGFLALIVCFYPMYFVVVGSFSDPRLVLAGKTFLIPRGVTLEGYKLVFEDPRILGRHRPVGGDHPAGRLCHVP